MGLTNVNEKDHDYYKPFTCRVLSLLELAISYATFVELIILESIAKLQYHLKTKRSRSKPNFMKFPTHTKSKFTWKMSN